MTSPNVWLESVETSTSRLLETLRSSSDQELLQHSTLQGWSRAHVAGHVARNADALMNLVTWARTGEMRPMYNSRTDRHEGIMDTAAQSHNELCEDVAQSAERLHQAMRELTPEQWGRPIHWRFERAPGAADRILLLRWVEVEVHHTDLRAGYNFTDWPTDFVQTMLPRLIEDREVNGIAVPATLVAEAGTTLQMQQGGPPVSGPPWLLVAWLTGRASISGSPDLPPWR